ncbi:nitroreductase family protein [Sporolactobacillus shoreicorticis]|nr:nitroreductase family protein [Sporolactobacillus shoreicorticis]
MHAAQQAPSSANMQPYSIIGITDPDRKKELARRSENPPIVECGYLFIFCADLYRLMETASEEERVKMKSNLSFNYFYQMALVSSSIALQNANLAAESLGLGSVIIAGVTRALPQLERWLELPELVIPIVGLAVGVPDQIPEQKPRLPQQAVFFEDHYTKDLKADVEEYDRETMRYYTTRSSNSQKASWSGKNKKMLTADLPLDFWTDYVRGKGLDLR